MFHTGFGKEFPKVPYVRDDAGNEYPVILQKELTGRDGNKFMKHVNLHNLVDGVSNTNIDFNIVVQRLTDKKNTSVSFHTWILNNINKNMYIIPNDNSVDIKANFKYTLCSLVPQFNSSDKSLFVDGRAQISHNNGNVMFLPQNVTKFVLTNLTYPFYVVASIIKDLTITMKDGNDIYTKQYYRTGITLHVLIDPECGQIQLTEIIEYFKNFFRISL